MKFEGNKCRSSLRGVRKRLECGMNERNVLKDSLKFNNDLEKLRVFRSTNSFLKCKEATSGLERIKNI